MGTLRKRAALGLTIFCFYAQGQSFLAMYGFPNASTGTGSVDPGPVPQVNGLAFGHFTAVGVPAGPTASARFSFAGWPVGAGDSVDDPATYTAALSPFSYYETFITVLPGHTLELSAIEFDVRRSGTGVRNYCVRSGADNYNSNLAASTGTSVSLGVLPGDVFFWKFDGTQTGSDQAGSRVAAGPMHSALTGETRFRFYAWNSESQGGTFSVDNVAFSGIVKDSLYTRNAGLQVPGNEVRAFSRGGRLVIACGAPVADLRISDAAGKAVLAEFRESGDLIEAGLDAGFYVVTGRTSTGVFRRKVIVR